MDGKDYQAAKARYIDGPDKDDLKEKLDTYRRAGVSFYRDGGDHFGAGLYARRIAGDFGIDLRTPGFAIHQKGHYGSIVGRSFATFKEYLSLVEQVLEGGGDFIKIMCSGILDFQRGGMTEEPVERGLIYDMVAAAHEAGFAVMAHVDGAGAVMDAVLAGVDSVEHGFGMNERCLTVMKEKNTVWVPTMATVANLAGSGRFPDSVTQSLARQQAAAVRHAKILGVLVAPGSDAGAYCVPHGSGIMDEYAHIRRALSGLAGEEETDAWLRSGAQQIMERFRHPRD